VEWDEHPLIPFLAEVEAEPVTWEHVWHVLDLRASQRRIELGDTRTTPIRIGRRSARCVRNRNVFVAPQDIGGNDKPETALAEGSVSEDIVQSALQRPGRVLGSNQVAQDPSVAQVEDARAVLGVEVDDLCRAQAGPERESDDAAGRRARDEVEVLGDGQTEVLFGFGQHRGREHALVAAAVESKDLKPSGHDPILSDPCDSHGRVDLVPVVIPG
jgi:hypothetical protein